MSRWRRRTGARGSRKTPCITTASQVCREMGPRKQPRLPRCTSSLPASAGKGCRPGRRFSPARWKSHQEHGDVMNSLTGLRFALLLTVWATTWPSSAAAQTTSVLPSPLSLGDVIRLASERRDEIQAARARVRAGEARPTIVSALQDPMISPSLDHLPFMLGGADVSFTIEQQIPLSGIRGHRRASALADVDRLRAEASRTTLDVGLQAVNAFLMVQERRRTAALVTEQLSFARDVVSAANARYASGTAPQSDVLRAEVEVARLDAAARALVSEVRGAEAMLNTSLALDADSPLPPFAALAFAQPPPSWAAIKTALTSRPELVAGRAEIVRAEADVQIRPASSRISPGTD